MSATARVSATVLGLALVIGGAAAPASADQAARSGNPDVAISQQSPGEILRGRAKKARAAYAAAIKTAKADRRAALVGPRATLAAALEAATTKAERRLARRTYARAAAPILEDYAAAKLAAAVTRDAAIDEALAEYLVATGKAAFVEALEAYRLATEGARDTLKLALESGRNTFKTDTADERAQLMGDLEQAETESDRTEAWKDFVAAADDERSAHNTSIAAARAAYRSALAKARAEFKLETGITIRSLLKLPFKV